MKIAKLLSMAPVLAACLALAAVSVAQIGCWRTPKTGLGMVSLRVDRMNMQKVEASLEKNGVIKLDGKKVEMVLLEDDSVYFPGKSLDRRKINIRENGEIGVDEKLATILYFRGYGRKWDAKLRCYCPDPPFPPLPWPLKKKELGNVSLLLDGKNKQMLKVILEINGALKLGDKRVKELRLEDGVVLRLGESTDQRPVATGKTGELRVGGVLVTSIHFDSDTVEWDLGAKSYRSGPPPPKAPAPPRE